MNVYLARQPIFDRQLNIFGYELLYRQSLVNAFSGIDDDQATSELIYNSFLVIGLEDLTDGKKAFINFSKKLIDSDLPLLLPKEHIIIEVLEREEATQTTIDACKRMQELGYMLALDDFIYEDNFLPLIENANIIKVEFPSVEKNLQQKMIRRYGRKIKFLAEKIETREDFQLAMTLGYDYFQGYFFSKPAMVSKLDITTLNSSLLSVLNELNKLEPSYSAISEIIESDLGLSYKLLKLANSAFFGARKKITSIQFALSYIGLKEQYQWISLMMLKDFQKVENAEMLKLSVVRGKLMELLAKHLQVKTAQSEYYLTGMFSFIDVLLNQPMKEIMDGLPFSDLVKQALCGEDNAQRQMLDYVIACEKGDWQNIRNQQFLEQIDAAQYMTFYLQAIKWAKKLEF